MSVSSEFRKIIAPLLRKVGISATRSTGAEALERFFDSVSPKTTNHRLVRIGGAGDGGYLVPDDLQGIEACFSPGVATVADFELDLANKGVRCFLADYSVDGLPAEHPLFHFEKKYLGSEETDVFTTLESWMARCGTDSNDLILQMDIEGAEYDVLLDASHETLRRFRIIVIEFHNVHALIDEHGYKILDTCFRKILKNFEVVHIHPNNCSKVVEYKGYELPPVMEFTFLRKDRISNAVPTVAFPHELDATNAPNKADFALPQCWFAHKS